MTLNELIVFAQKHNINFNKDIVCINMIDDNLVLDNLEQIAMKEIDKENKLVIIPSSLSYNADMNEEFEFCDTVNSCDGAFERCPNCGSSNISKDGYVCLDCGYSSEVELLHEMGR